MTLIGHALTGACAFGALLPLTTPSGILGVILGTLGAVLPDVMETRIIPGLTFNLVLPRFHDTEKRRGRLYFHHRGILHDLGLYVALWFALFLLDWYHPCTFTLPPACFDILDSVSLNIEGGNVSVWMNLFALGAVWHVLCDMGSMSGVPVLGTNCALRLYRVGTATEAILVAGICVFLGGIGYWRSYAAPLEWSLVLGRLWAASRGFVAAAVVLGSVVVAAVYVRRVPLHVLRRTRRTAHPLGTISMAEIVANYRYGPGRALQGEDSHAEPSHEAPSSSPSEVAEGGAAPAETPPQWSHRSLTAFYDAIQDIAPAEQVVLREILTILDTHGAVSSVHGDNRGAGGTYDVLAQVSLLDHSLNVARIGMDLLRRQYPDTYRPHIFRTLAACLLHDIGKADTLIADRRNYSRDDHAYDGANWCLDFLMRYDVAPAVRQDIFEAIRLHHQKGGSGSLVGDILISADRQARAEEYQRYGAASAPAPASAPEPTADGPVRPTPAVPACTTRAPAEEQGPPPPPNDPMHAVMAAAAAAPQPKAPRSAKISPLEIPAAFSHEKLLGLMRQCVNVPKIQAKTELNEWKSISQPDGYAYFKLDFLGKIISESAEEQGVRDYAMLTDDEEYARQRMLACVDYWRQQGWLHPAIKPGFFSQRFQVRDGATGKTFVVALVALRVDALEVRAGEVEEERRQYPRLRNLTVLGVATAPGTSAP